MHKGSALALAPETVDRLHYILAAGESLLRVVDDILSVRFWWGVCVCIMCITTFNTHTHITFTTRTTHPAHTHTQLFRLSSASERGRLRVRLAGVDVPALFGTVCDLVALIAQEHGLYFTRHLDPALPRFLYLGTRVHGHVYVYVMDDFTRVFWYGSEGSSCSFGPPIDFGLSLTHTSIRTSPPPQTACASRSSS